MNNSNFLRHTLATINYRANASILDAPDALPETKHSEEHWSALQTLRHMNDVLKWAMSLAKGAQVWATEEAASWHEEVGEFHQILQDFDGVLSMEELEANVALGLLQGPLADVLTHIGQLASLRRISGKPVAPQNYFVAEIEAGKIGPPTA